MHIPLEDNFTDVIAKAQRGWSILDHQLEAETGVAQSVFEKIKKGEVVAESLLKIAPVLHLKGEALLDLALGNYRPDVLAPDGLAVFNTPFEDFTVNSYLIWDLASKEAVVFDTGSDASELLATVAEKGLKVKTILLTHTHGDHIFDLDRVVEATRASVYGPREESLAGVLQFKEGSHFSCGKMEIEVRLTNGHSPGGSTFVVSGGGASLAIVGDSLFAGSMGGAGLHWEKALTNNREKILSLPSDTIICPGHGPLTTVRLEQEHNPFFPGE